VVRLLEAAQRSIKNSGQRISLTLPLLLGEGQGEGVAAR